MIIPPQTRTIYIKIDYIGYNISNECIHKHNAKTIVENGFHKAIFKFKLNIPKMCLTKTFDNVRFYPLDENDQPCFSPFLNTTIESFICVDNTIQDSEQDVLNKIYNSYFNFDRYTSLYQYIENLEKFEDILNFYQFWQDTGELKLIPTQS
jgi:hypothetical protein